MNVHFSFLHMTMIYLEVVGVSTPAGWRVHCIWSRIFPSFNSWCQTLFHCTLSVTDLPTLSDSQQFGLEKIFFSTAHIKSKSILVTMNPFRKPRNRESHYEKLNTDETDFKNHVELRCSRHHYRINAILLIFSIIFFILGSAAFYIAGSHNYHKPSDWCEFCRFGSSYLENS